MNYEDLLKQQKFQEILDRIPENEREDVQKAIRALVEDFNDKILKPLASVNRR